MLNVGGQQSRFSCRQFLEWLVARFIQQLRSSLKVISYWFKSTETALEVFNNELLDRTPMVILDPQGLPDSDVLHSGTQIPESNLLVLWTLKSTGLSRAQGAGWKILSIKTKGNNSDPGPCHDPDCSSITDFQIVLKLLHYLKTEANIH